MRKEKKEERRKSRNERRSLGGIRYILEQASSYPSRSLRRNVGRYIILEEGGNTCLIQFLEQAPRRPFNFSSANRTHPASSPPPPCSPFYSPTECCAYRDTSDSESLQECDKNMTPPVPTNLSIDPSILANPHFSSFSADNVSREIRGSRYNRPFVPKIYI